MEDTQLQGEDRAPEKWRPILYTGEMVRAIQDDKKHQTRRLVDIRRLQVDMPRTVRSEIPFIDTYAPPGRYRATLNPHGAVAIVAPDGELFGVKPGEFNFVCPYADGVTSLTRVDADRQVWHIDPGPRQFLWVRERITRSGGYIQYLADHRVSKHPWPAHWKQDPRPSIHMPRLVSRLSLLVTSVRLERVQDITEEDAQAEGISEPAPAHGEWCDPARGREGHWSYRKRFADLWDQINAARGGCWSSNPWVWSIKFHRI